jgi:uncharacterized protein YecE (DUF72 family)
MKKRVDFILDDHEFDEFIERMHLLGDKLGPILLQFPIRVVTPLSNRGRKCQLPGDQRLYD